MTMPRPDFEKLRQQEACSHKWLPIEQVQTSHGAMWRTECALCGRHVSRGDYGDLSQTIMEMEPPHDKSIRVSEVRDLISRLRKPWIAGNTDYGKGALGVLEAVESEINQLAGKAET